MPALNARRSTLLVIDFQAKLMPAIHEGTVAVANTRRLIDAAGMVRVPVLWTEQNPDGLGPTIPTLAPATGFVQRKMSFDATRAPGFLRRLPDRHAAVVVAGCEAHVCVLQTVLGLLADGRRVFVAADALGSRRPDSKEAALRRMERHGAEIVTAEMAVFEWLESAEHPRFRDVIALIK